MSNQPTKPQEEKPSFHLRSCGQHGSACLLGGSIFCSCDCKSHCPLFGEDDGTDCYLSRVSRYNQAKGHPASEVLTITTTAVLNARKAKHRPTTGRDALLNAIASNALKSRMNLKGNPADGKPILHGHLEMDESHRQIAAVNHPSHEQKGKIFKAARSMSPREQKIFRAMIRAESDLYPRVKIAFTELYPNEKLVSDKTFYGLRDQIKKRFEGLF